MRIFWKIIDGIILTCSGILAILLAWELRNAPNPSLLFAFGVFVFGVMLIAFGVKSFCYGRIPD